LRTLFFSSRLQEPKRELIERVVSVIGKKKAIELLGETATLEENGGVYTMVCNCIDISD